ETASSSVAPRTFVVWARSGDRVEVDGMSTDLATTLALARDAGSVVFHATGDARTGWVTKVHQALVDAGVDVRTPMGVLDHAHTAVSALGSLGDARAFLADVRNASPVSSSQSCPPRPGGGALVRSSYRVSPFLADDVL